MVGSPDFLHLAIEIDGAGSHPAAWRAWGHPPEQLLSPRILRSTTAAAEKAGISLVTFADTVVPESAPYPVGRLDAGTRAAYLASTTDRIGLAPTVQTLTTEPFHVATQLAGLDHASRGRAAWVVGADNSADANDAVGFAARSTEAARAEVRDVVDLARRLWDSWEDDAVIRDAATGRYLDPDKVHHVRFSGEFFDVVGPLITPRPPQGQIVVVGDADLGVSDLLDITLVSGRDETAIAEGAARHDGLTFAEIEIVLDDSGQAAQSRLTALDDHATWHDSGRFRFVGSAPEFVDLLRSLTGTVDGVRIHPAVATTDLGVLYQSVVPALQELSLHRAPQVGATLRETLGLPRPVSRYASPSTR
ncbi:LLM class flavin-dependent oxidoreductase [Rhodococcus sp. 27YEA15]|uniref:LLM class flavin-dependent oxidoreductase n=1 Tax=Rhodococcus sp. 27YEA15 TaxID=3156259 RepID=UPI003C7CE46D